MSAFGIAAAFGAAALIANPAPVAAADFGALERIARASLAANIYELKMGWYQKKDSVPFAAGGYLAAGAHQFKSLWTRDFCFASRGLYPIGRADVVKRQLTLILDNMRREDGLVPRYLGSASDRLRQVTYALHLPIPLGGHLEPEYDAGGGGEGMAVDSNALVLLTALEYVARTGDQGFWQAYRPFLVRVFRYYEKLRDPADGLIVQSAFADWQDSVDRSGKTAFVNLLYLVAAERLKSDPAFRVDEADLARTRESFLRTFLDPASGLLVSIAGHAKYVSLDANLLAIDLGFFPPESAEAQALYGNLKRHPLWASKDIPGFATSERYPREWIGKLPALIGLPDYHDQIFWSWLIGLSAKTARLMKDDAEASRIFTRMQELALRDGAITEVFEPDPEHKPVSRVVDAPVLRQLGYRVFRAEHPFSWGAGIILDALVSTRR